MQLSPGVSASFVLVRDGVARLGSGATAAFTSVAQARQALADGAVPVVTGAIGFDVDGVAALSAPERFDRDVVLPAAESLSPRTAQVLAETPSDVHRERVVRALAAIDDGVVEKVVLARHTELLLDEPAEPGAVVASFIANAPPQATVFGVSLDPVAGRAGHRLIGASPELLVRREGRVVTCHPFAGSAPRQADPVADEDAGRSLLDSRKDLAEHAFVVDDLRARLAPLCAELEVPDAPVLGSTGELWHLATPIRGVLSDDSVTALDLAALLSPTPAVCGTPTEAAATLIGELEEPRDFYAGAVGWCDAHGDGEWMVSIRCLELAADHRTVTTWAGGGIVAGSDPDAEVAETVAKFRTVRRALGLD